MVKSFSKRITGTEIYKGARGQGTKPTGERARRLRASGFEPKDVGPEQAQFILKEGLTGKKTMFGGYKIEGPSKKDNPQKYMKQQDQSISNRLRKFDENPVWRKDRDYNILSKKKIRGELTEREKVYYNELDRWFQGTGREKQLIRESKVLTFFSKGKDKYQDIMEKRREAAERRDKLKEIDAKVKAEEKRIRKGQQKQKISAFRESVPGVKKVERATKSGIAATKSGLKRAGSATKSGLKRAGRATKAGFQKARRAAKDISQKARNFREARRKKKERAKELAEKVKQENESKPATGKYSYTLT